MKLKAMLGRTKRVNWKEKARLFSAEAYDLRLENKQLRDKLEDAEANIAFRAKEQGKLRDAVCALEDQLERARNLIHFDEGTARAALMQLRVHQTSEKFRTGYGITFFIPTEVVDKLRTATVTDRLNFRDMVFSSLLEFALKGVFHSNSRGNLSAMVFFPLGSRTVAGEIFDVDRNPHIEFPTSKATDPTVRHIENTILRAQRGLSEEVGKKERKEFIRDDMTLQQAIENGANTPKQLKDATPNGHRIDGSEPAK